MRWCRDSINCYQPSSTVGFVTVSDTVWGGGRGLEVFRAGGRERPCSEAWRPVPSSPSLPRSPLVDSTLPTGHDLTMRRSSSIRFLSCLLLLILGALATGLPSHSHRVPGDDFVELVAPDHHGHGVILTEQTDRVPTIAVLYPVPAGTIRLVDRPVLVASAAPPPQGDLPNERAPPSTSPRAPPLPI